MNEKHKLKYISSFFLILLFISPVLTSLLYGLSVDSESQQYTGLQMFVQGFYNLPFFITAIITFGFGDYFKNREKPRDSDISYLLTIGISIVGIIVQVMWVF